MRRIPVFLVGAVLLLSGCSGKTPVSSGAIAFLGDSITAGYGLEPSQAYPALLDIPGMTVENLGVSGSTSADGLQRLKTYFERGNTPRLVVIALGANDLLRGMDFERIKLSLNGAIAECRARKIPVLLCGVSIPGKFGTAALFQEVANQNHVPLMPDILQGAAFHEELMQDDHMHPTAEGQKRIARAMTEVLLKNFGFEKKD